MLLPCLFIVCVRFAISRSTGDVMKPIMFRKRFICIMLCCSLLLACACGQSNTPQSSDAAVSETGSGQSSDAALIPYAVKIVKAEPSFGV